MLFRWSINLKVEFHICSQGLLILALNLISSQFDPPAFLRCHHGSMLFYCKINLTTVTCVWRINFVPMIYNLTPAILRSSAFVPVFVKHHEPGQKDLEPERSNLHAPNVATNVRCRVYAHLNTYQLLINLSCVDTGK